jgi:uncharacterized membrane protein YcaP (DUF421 family)
METLLALGLRIIVIYVYMLLAVRLAGKRSILEGTPFDFVIALIIGELPGDVIWGDVPLAQGIVAISTIMLLHLLVVSGVYRSPLLYRIIESIPSTMIKAGKAIPKELAFERINNKELDAMLRECEVDDRQDVENAWLEPSGNLTVKRTAEAQLAEKRDLPKLQEALR